MGPIRLGRVIKSYIAKVPGSGLLAQWLAVEELAGDERKAQVFGPSNEDFVPPNNTKTIDAPLGPGRGFLASLAYHNQKIEPVATAGETRKYATNAEGDTVKAEVFLKADGTVEVKNALGSVVIQPNGTIGLSNLNGSVYIGHAGGVLSSNANGSMFLDTDGEIVLTPAAAVTINGELVVTGDIYTASGDVQAGAISLKGHVHSANNVNQPLTGLPQ